MNARFVMAQLGRVVQLLGAVLSTIAVLFVLVPGRDMTFFDVGEQCLLITGVGALALGTMGWRAGRAACTVPSTARYSSLRSPPATDASL